MFHRAKMSAMKVTSQLPFFRRAIRMVAWRLHGWAENRDDARMHRNGEAWLLGALAEDWARDDRTRRRVVVDAGANRGSFTAAVLAAADAAGVPVAVYAFEPAPEAIPLLTARFANEPRVMVVRAAVSDCEGVAPLFAAAGASELASLVKRDPGADDVAPAVAVTTLAAYFGTHGIGVVDFLKLDIEGAEHAALLGCGEWLNPETIATIQFEYGGTTLDAGKRLRDFFDLLIPRGYQVAKLFPGWIDVRSYDSRFDNFYYSNWVAVARSRGRAMGEVAT